MKVLFLVFHNFDNSDGISKKIKYQIKALRNCGAEVDVCWIDENKSHKKRMINDQVLQDYGGGVKGKILKRISLKCIYNFIKDNKVSILYIRSDHNTTPFFIHFLRKVKKLNTKILIEIPTYPYDHEYKDLGWAYQKIIYMDKCFRKLMAKYVDKIVTFSNHKNIFGCPTIPIANGIDFEEVPLKQNACTNHTFNLIAVATIHPWHGFDRAIAGLINYKPYQSKQKVILHIIGQGVPNIVNQYKKLVNLHQLNDFVIFHGPLYGPELNNIFNIAHLGIGSLARHRSGITHLRSLKNREYAARGIPFVYSEIDDDFEQMPYILKIPANDSALDINQLITFHKNLNISSEDIRNSIVNLLSWNSQMSKILKAMKNNN